MKNILLCISLFSTLFVNAQNRNNLVVFSQDMQPFIAFVNGIQQNAQPRTNVKITDLVGSSYNVKIQFQNNIPQIDKNIFVDGYGKEVTYRLINTNRGYKLRFFGEGNINGNFQNNNQTVIVYRTTPMPQTSGGIIFSEQTTTTTHSNTSQSNNVNVNVGGVGVNININDGISNPNTSTTTTTTTTTYGTGTIVYVDGYTGGIGCEIPQSSINNIKSVVENQSFSDEKINTLKTATRNKCLKVSQVIELLDLLTFDDNRIDFAKYAYDRTYDVDNYYQVVDKFTFSSSKDELNQYILNR